MGAPYESDRRGTSLSVAGRSLALPCFFPSISSIKTNLPPFEYLRILVGINHPQFLISAFDLKAQIDDDKVKLFDLLHIASSRKQLVLLDSGNYESYWKNDRTWDLSSFEYILKNTDCHLAFSFDWQDSLMNSSETLVRNIEEAVMSSQKATAKATIIPILHANTNMLPDLAFLVASRLYPLMIAIPERELGEGIIQRAKTVLKVRMLLDQTGVYVPLHLLGTGNPLSILLYSICGADSFDGLEWCQTTVDHSTGLLYHFQQRELFGNQSLFCSAKELPYEHATLTHNLLFYRNWMRMIQDSIMTTEINNLISQYFSQSFIDDLHFQLEGLYR